MPARSRFVTIECLESRQLLSAAAAAVFDHADIAPVLPNVAATSSATHAAAPQKVITKATGTTATTTNLSLDATSTNPAAQGDFVTFDAIVNPLVPMGAGEQVQFFDNGVSIGQAPVVAGTGTSIATFTTNMLALGSHPITAAYMGDSTFAASPASNIVTELIGVGTTTTVVASSMVVAPGAPGVSFTATVTPASGMASSETGMVTFSANKMGVITPLGGVTLMNGTATTAMITTLGAGTYSVTATYSGDANFVGSVSATPATVTVSTPTTTVLTDTLMGGAPVPAMITPGTTVVFTATVTPNPLGGPAIDGDSVTFLNNGVAFGSAITNNGVATLPFSMLPSGPDNITASFPGDGTYRASVSAAKSITVAQVATTTTLMESSPTVALGGAAVFMATVNPAPTMPGENVMFFEGATMLGSTPIVNGTATFTDSSLPLGSHMIYAVYPGDAGNIASTSNTVTEVIGIATATSLAAFPSGSVTPGTQVNFTATVTQMPPTVPAPTGQVNFSDNGALIGSGVLTAGVATFSTAALPSGVNNITATYTGDASNVSSTSMAQTITVGLATTLMVTSPNPTAALGSPVVLNVTVNPAVLGGPTPTGSVTFFDGNNPIMPNGTTPLVNGMASITVNSLPSGSNTITVSYTGDLNYFPNHPATNVVIMVGAASGLNANLAPKSSAPSAGLASLVTFTATVTGVGMAMPTGTVEFDDGGVMIGTGTLVNGVATFSTPTLPPGPNIITAIYSGDTSFNPANGGPITVTIGAVPSTPTNTILTSSAPSAALGNNITFTATINPTVNGGPAPTGLVVFLNGTTFVGQAMVQPNGVATLVTGALPAGVDGITANYAGDIANGASVSNPVTETIGAAPGSTVNVQVVSTALAIGVGGTVTITANVRPVVIGPVPTGNVTFFLNGAIVLGTAPVQNIGTAVLTLNTLPAGADKISASYSGDTTYDPANSLQITINVGANVGILGNTTDITTSNASVNVGAPITFTATVTPNANGGALPTGKVTFLSDGVVFGIANLVNGVATLTTSSLPQGLNIISANYSGDAAYAPSTSITINETVGTIPQTATFTSLVTSNPLVNIGDTAMLTATVTAADGTIPTGTVSFIEGTTTMGSALLQPDGTATFSLPILMAGIDDIRATYDGALFYSASTSPVITETVGPALPGTTTTALTASTGLIAVGGSITFTATIVAAIPGGLTPTGAVTFFNGSTQLAVTPVQADGTAVLTTTALLAGIDNITATYGGDTVYTTSTSPAFSVAVGPITPTYTTALDVTSGSAPVGGPVVFTATVTPSSTAAAPTGDVTFLAGTTVLGVAVVESDGTASFKTTSLPNGTNSITAVFSGATGVSGPSPVITEMVSSLPPSLDLPSVSGESVPTGGVVAGTKTSIKLPVTITNTSMGISTGPFTLNIYLNTGTTLDGHEILAGTGTRFFYLNPTASSKPWKVLLKSLPSTVPTGTYHIIIQSVDPNGSTASVTASETINVIAPFVNLAATVSAVTPGSLQVGQNGSVTLTLTNNGNIDANGALSIVLNLSADGISPLSVAGTILTTMTANHMVLKAHQTRTFRIHFKPTAVIAAGTYFPFASISLGSFSASVVGTTKFTIG